jgi:Holliday junction DNA helicase RuvA
VIGRLSGIVLEKRPDRAVVDASGVGYELHVPLGTFASLPGIGERATLHVHTHVREDAILLFGFTTAEEKALFERLITVSGIGPKLALVVLSGLPLPELVGAIAAQNVARLSTIPGVGKKLAERLGVELKDKVSGILSSSSSSTVFGVPTALGGFLDDAVGALVNLGYRKPQAEAAVKAASDGTVPADLPALLSAALRLLSR